MTWLDDASSADMIAAIREHTGAGPVKLAAAMGVNWRTVCGWAAGDAEPHGCARVLLRVLCQSAEARDEVGLGTGAEPLRPRPGFEPPAPNARVANALPPHPAMRGEVPAWDWAETINSLQRAGLSYANARVLVSTWFIDHSESARDRIASVLATAPDSTAG